MTKIDILNASISIISLEGFEKLTLSTLADKLGVKKASIYYYFSSKDEIILSLYENAKNIIRKMPDKIIKVSKFNIYQPDIFGRDELRERVDYVQLVGKSKLVFMSESIVNGQPWVAYLSHLSAELRRDILKQIVKTYRKQN